MFGPRDAAPVFEVDVVHLVLVLVPLSDSEDVLVLFPLNRDVVECVLQQSHFFSLRLIPLFFHGFPLGWL